jgi:hypothetical protein
MLHEKVAVPEGKQWRDGTTKPGYLREKLFDALVFVFARSNVPSSAAKTRGTQLPGEGRMAAEHWTILIVFWKTPTFGLFPNDI